jgi:hypothetical protein
MTAPDAQGTADALAESSGASLSMVTEQFVGSISTIGAFILPIVAVLVLVFFVVAALVAFRRVNAEVRSGRRALDPRHLVDPTASDVLGEW